MSRKGLKNGIMAAALLIGTVGLFTGCGPKADGKSSSLSSDGGQVQEQKVLRIGVPGTDDALNLEVAKIALEKGFMEEELSKVGYTLEVNGFANAGPAVNEAMASGDIDIGIYGDMPACIAKANGVDTSIIGSVNGQLNEAVIVQPGTKMTSPKDLEGKKVIVGIGTNFQLYWQLLVDAYGIDESKVELINTVSDAGSVFTSGEADALVCLDTSAVYYESLGVAEILADTVDVPEQSSEFLVVASNKFLKENEEAAVALLKSLIRSREFAVENPEEVYEVMATENVNAELMEKVYGFDTSFEYFAPKISDLVRGKLDVLNEFLLEHEFTKELLNMDEFINTSYYEKAVSE